MINKVDTVKLEQYIGELKSLCSEWSGRSKKVENIGDNSGRTLDKMTETTEAIQSLQDGFVSLINNTILYMEQRKESVDNKENIATEKISN